MFLQVVNEAVPVELFTQALGQGKDLEMLNAPTSPWEMLLLPLEKSSPFCPGEAELDLECILKKDLSSHLLAPELI